MSYVRWPNNEGIELKESMTKQLQNIKKVAEDFQKEMENDIARAQPDYESPNTTSSDDQESKSESESKSK